jgi:hypothetical protein
MILDEVARLADPQIVLLAEGAHSLQERHQPHFILGVPSLERVRVTVHNGNAAEASAPFDHPQDLLVKPRRGIEAYAADPVDALKEAGPAQRALGHPLRQPERQGAVGDAAEPIPRLLKAIAEALEVCPVVSRSTSFREAKCPTLRIVEGLVIGRNKRNHRTPHTLLQGIFTRS